VDEEHNAILLQRIAQNQSQMERAVLQRLQLNGICKRLLYNEKAVN
jgi:hypothetical protein